MAITLKKQKTWLDLILGKKLHQSQIPMMQDLSIVDYNSDYLCAFMNLQIPGQEDLVTVIKTNGQIQTHNSKTDKELWMQKYLQLFKKVHTEPWIIVNGDTNILESLHLTGKELRAVRNKTISIFYYEPLFVRSKDSHRVPAFFDRHTKTYFPELEWQKSFMANHGNKFKVKAFVCDYGLRKYLSTNPSYAHLDVETWDIFLADTFRSLYEKEIDRDYEFFKKPYPFKSQVTKKFICPNFRYEGMRELVVGYLKGSPWGEEGHISYFHHHNKDHFFQDLHFDPRKLKHYDSIQRGIESMQSQLPLTLDSKNNQALHPHVTSLPDIDGKSNQRTNHEFHQWYDDAFLAIVNETRYSTLCGELSEKTMLPILYMRPFIVVAGPYMLRYLRELGFETFGDLWDESYDLIEDHEQRAQAILNLMDQLLSKPLDEMQHILDKMNDRLKRNRDHLLFTLQKQFHDNLRAKLSSP